MGIQLYYRLFSKVCHPLTTYPRVAQKVSGVVEHCWRLETDTCALKDSRHRVGENHAFGFKKVDDFVDFWGLERINYDDEYMVVGLGPLPKSFGIQRNKLGVLDSYAVCQINTHTQHLLKRFRLIFNSPGRPWFLRLTNVDRYLPI
jgi:hypothetical protein